VQEPEAEKLIMQSLAVNYVDMETTPSTTDIQNRYTLCRPLLILH